MFEAITQTQPEDYQSLEILREAYTKIGRHDEALRTSRKLAEAYFNAGSYTPALQQRLQASGQAIVDKSKQTSGLVNSPFTRNDGSLISPNVEGSLIDVDPARGKGLGRITNLHERGDDHLAKFLIVQQLFGEEEVNAAHETVKVANKELQGQALAA